MSSDKVDNAPRFSKCTTQCNVTRYNLILSEVEMSKRFIITSRLEDQSDVSSWPDNPDENPLYVQSWAFLNEVDPNVTDYVSAFADLLENIYYISNGITGDFPIFQDALNTSSDLYRKYDDFRFDLTLRTNIQIGSKSCKNSSNLNGCLTAYIAAEQVNYIKNALKTCSITESFFHDIEEHFGHFEEAMSTLLEGISSETKKRNMSSSVPDIIANVMVNRSVDLDRISDDFARLRANVSALLATYDKMVSQCKAYEDVIEEYWAKSEISKAGIEDMIR